MEDQEQKNHLLGVETQYHHQVHHCRKCGWPFPKPHPSAKHRRAHKRVCGTLEGYKLQDSSHTIVSDDDHSDDGDFKTPQISFKKRLERSPSEDDVYSDAVSNFADASLNSGVGGSPEIASQSASAVEKVSKAVVVPEFSASAAGNLTSSVTVQAPMIAPTIADKSGKRPNSGDLSSTIVAETQFDFSESASNVHESDAESLVESLTGTKSPIENDAKAEFSLNDKVKVINDIPDAAESMLQATDEVSAIADPNEGFALTVEMPNGKLVSKTPQNDISPEHFAVQESEGADSGGDVEHNGKADEGVHLFHVPHDVPAVEHPEKFIEGFKDHPKKEDVRSDNFDIEVEHSPSVGEYNTTKEDELRKVNVSSVLQNVPVLVNQEKIIEGYEKMGWVGYDNRDFPNAVEEKGEVSCLASDVLLEKDGLISNPIDQEVEVEVVTDDVHKSQQLHEYGNLSDALLDDGKKKGISDEEASLEASKEFDSNIPVKSAEEVTSEEDDRSMNVACVVPDSVPVITHTGGECLISGEVGVIKEEEISDVKSLPDTDSVLSLNTGAPRTTILDGEDDSNSAAEIVSTGIQGDKNMEEDKIPAFEAPSAVEDGYVDESCVEIFHQPISDAVTVTVTVTGAEVNMKCIAEEEEVDGTVDTRTLNLDTEGDNTISAVEFDVEFGDNSSSSPVTEKLPRDVENGTKAEEEEEEEEERFVGGDSSSVAEIGIVHVAEDDSFRKEAAAEDSSSVQSSLLDELAVRSIVMEKREVAVVESPRKCAASETLTHCCLEAERTTVVVDEVLAEKEQLKKGDDEVKCSSMNEVGHDFSKEAALLPVGTVSQVPNSLTVVEEEDGTKQQQLTASVLDSSSSPSESLDANWGSVSVVPTQSDTITPPSDEPKKVGKPNAKQQQATAVGDKLETSFEDPSPLVVDSSSPLKNLLVEANRGTKPIFLKDSSSSSSIKEDNGAAASTVASILTSNTETKAASAISEEWNSPARYPSEIKRDKKVKGRPYWAQFVCCSSGIN